MTKINLQPVKGTRDFYPEEMRFRRWLFGKMRLVSEKFGFEEYDGPILEPVELYLGKSSEELIKKQTFLLKDRSGKTLALRPELTPSLARMVAYKKDQLTLPLRWFSIGPRFRYEQPQKGRLREFYQWDVDLLGVDTPEADAEVIALAITFLKELGFTPQEVVVKINSRKLMDFKFSLMNLSEDKKKAVLKAIDRKDKMKKEEWLSYLKSLGLKDLQIKDLEKILQDTDYKIESPELTEVFSTLSDLGVAEYAQYDPNIVRGLDYYTGTVFEVRDRQGNFRAIMGGGRYDNLVENIGGEKVSGIGFAAGDVLLELLIKEYKKKLIYKKSNTSILVTVFGESFYRSSLLIANKLRSKGLNCEFYLKVDKLDKQLKYADKRGIPYVIIIGPDEEKTGKVTVKDMVMKKQEMITLEEFIRKISSV